MQSKTNVNKRVSNLKWYDAKLTADVFIHLFCFISVLLIGADIFGLKIGINIRLDQIFLVILTLLLAYKNSYHVTKNKWIFAFVLCSFISTIFSFKFTRGVMFFASIIYNVIFIFYSFSNYVKTYGIQKFILIFRYTCYVQFFIFLLQYVLKVGFNYEFSLIPSYGYFGGVPRFKLWFYEPSYLATYMVFWFTISCYTLLVGNNKKYIWDLIACTLLLTLSTSSTGFIGMALSLLMVLIIWISQGITKKKFLVLLLIGVVLILFAFVFRDILQVYVGRLFSGSLDGASGGRITGWKETFAVFLQRPLFGVGPGNYGLFLGEEAGYVPTNVTLEIMSTLGIFSTIAFYGLTVSLIVNSIKIYRRNRNVDTSLMVACAVGLFVFTIVLQINQSYLRLYHWMIFGILQGAIIYNERNAKKGIKN